MPNSAAVRSGINMNPTNPPTLQSNVWLFFRGRFSAVTQIHLWNMSLHCGTQLLWIWEMYSIRVLVSFPTWRHCSLWDTNRNCCVIMSRLCRYFRDNPDCWGVLTQGITSDSLSAWGELLNLAEAPSYKLWLSEEAQHAEWMVTAKKELPVRCVSLKKWWIKNLWRHLLPKWNLKLGHVGCLESEMTKIQRDRGSGLKQWVGNHTKLLELDSLHPWLIQ